MLELFRKIFGCWHDNTLDFEEQTIPESHVIDMSDINEMLKQIRKKCDEEVKEKKEIIENIVSAVISDKEKGFISYVEEAQDSVTGGKFKFIKYRPKK